MKEGFLYCRDKKTDRDLQVGIYISFKLFSQSSKNWINFPCLKGVHISSSAGGHCKSKETSS